MTGTTAPKGRGAHTRHGQTGCGKTRFMLARMLIVVVVVAIVPSSLLTPDRSFQGPLDGAAYLGTDAVMWARKCDLSCVVSVQQCPVAEARSSSKSR